MNQNIPKPNLNNGATKVFTPLTWGYQALLQLHQNIYKYCWSPVKELPVPVISVGNLSVGGTGKTPIIVDLASQLLHHNIKVGILSRGYMRSNNTGCTVAGDGLSNYASSQEAGDEPLMIAKLLPQAVVIVDKDRFVAGQKAINDFNCQILLLDDAFQHWRLKRDCDIVLLDYNNPPWADNLLPIGRLRETPTALSRATYVVITKIPHNHDQQRIEQFKNLVTKYAPNCQLKMCRFEPTALHQLISGKWREEAIDKLKELPVVTFCGIAKPHSFFTLVKTLGANVLNEITFADHHNYSAHDIQLLEKQFHSSGAEYLLTTRKDLVKLENSAIASRLIAIDLNTEWIGEHLDIMDLLNKLPKFNKTVLRLDSLK